MNNIIYLVPAFGVIGLLYTFIKFNWVGRQPDGTPEMQKLSENLEKQREFQGKLKGALTYPVIVIVAMLGVMFIMVTFIIPKLLNLYKDFNIEPMDLKAKEAVADDILNKVIAHFNE